MPPASTMTPFDKRLMELQLLGQPTEELAFMEEYMRWKAEGGPAKFEANRQAERQRQYRADYELRVKATKRP
jgi:hypothetical protein